ncbi:MAG: hypothetical protein WBD25_07980 [Terriglobales bacterium]|jgi:protein CpxP
MLKQCLLVVLAASLISIAAPFAAAQDSQSAPPPSANDQQAPPSQGNGRWRHGQPDPAERTKELTKKLNLTADQQTKVLGIFQSEKSQMESLRQDSSVPQQDRRSKMMDLRESTNSQVRAALDANQQKKWDEMQTKREERMQNHRQGPPDGGQTPPPQQ